MSKPSPAAKVGSIALALLIGAGLILLAGNVLMPSTKRARVDWEEVRRLRDEAEAESTAPTTTAAADAPGDAATRPAAASQP